MMKKPALFVMVGCCDRKTSKSPVRSAPANTTASIGARKVKARAQVHTTTIITSECSKSNATSIQVTLCFMFGPARTRTGSPEKRSNHERLCRQENRSGWWIPGPRFRPIFCSHDACFATTIPPVHPCRAPIGIPSPHPAETGREIPASVVIWQPIKRVL